ncbi:hypothetical protein D3C81_1880710 [compost metagenome]
MHRAQTVAFHQRAEQADRQRCQDQRRPETDGLADAIREVGPYHVEAGMREIQYAHHAEDQRQPG